MKTRPRAVVTWILAVTWSGLSTGATGPAGTRPGAAATYSEALKVSEAYAGPRTAEALNRLKGVLANQGAPAAERLAALRELIDFAGSRNVYNRSKFLAAHTPAAPGPAGAASGLLDQETHLQREAAMAVIWAANAPLITAALESADPLLRFWALWHFRQHENGVPLLPQVEALALSDDPTLRVQAIRVLKTFPGEEAFLRGRVGVEKLPEALAAILGETPALAARLRELLVQGDAGVRTDVLMFLRASRNAAPARQLVLDAATVEAVLARAGAGEADAALAFDFFREVTDPDLRTVEFARQWWAGNRAGWEAGSIARFTLPQGGLRAAFTHNGRGTVDSPRGPMLFLQNVGATDLHVNLAKAEAVQWEVFDGEGRRVPTPEGLLLGPAGAPEFVTIRPGETRSKAVRFDTAALPGGKYVVRGVVVFDSDNPGAPAGVAMWQGQITLPGVVVQGAGR